MEEGKIIKGIAGFYYVYVPESGTYECKAKGVFRNQNIKPLVGDDVKIDVINGKDKTGSIVEILPRKNELARPAVANVDQAALIFALAAPNPNTNLIDRLLILMEQQSIPTVICMNKTDLVSSDVIENFRGIYRASAYPVFFFSAKTGEGTEQLKEQFLGRTTVVAGPSGGGKSTLINRFAPHAQMEIGELSAKIKRGKNTTRHSELIAMDDSSFIVDTPGFGSLDVSGFIPEKKTDGKEMTPVTPQTLREFFPEFISLQDECRFRGCSHLNEPGCAVRAAVECGEISASRYNSYQQIYKELKENNRY